MVRPKTILWVDDEVEGLAAHRRFLEDQGFTVAAAAHGDDALALLRRQAYSIVLLDEQMPGRRGLELIVEIRALDPAMPVVMVTQSEDEGTLREVANLTGGQYFAAGDAGRLQDVLRDLPRTVATQQRDVEVSVAPLALAAVLMLGALWAAGRWSVGS